jgi:hypothetical protein
MLKTGKYLPVLLLLLYLTTPMLLLSKRRWRLLFRDFHSNKRRHLSILQLIKKLQKIIKIANNALGLIVFYAKTFFVMES